MTDTLQWPWVWSPGTAKLQGHPGLLQYHLTGQAGRPLRGWEGVLSSAASSVSFRDEVRAQASSYQEANESLCRKSGLFVLYSEEQNSSFMGKNPSTWSWCPAGAKQKLWAVQAEIFMLLKVFSMVSLLTVHMALETDFSLMNCLHWFWSEAVVAFFLTDQWWHQTHISQSMRFSSCKSMYFRYFHYYPLSLCTPRYHTSFSALKPQQKILLQILNSVT